MKETKLQIRMKNGELEELKQKAKIYGMKNVSELVRSAIDLVSTMPEKNENAEKQVKECDSSSILWASRFAVNTLDIQELFKSDNIEKEEVSNKLLEAYAETEGFEGLKVAILTSIINDLSFKNDTSKQIDKLIKELIIKYMSK